MINLLINGKDFSRMVFSAKSLLDKNKVKFIYNNAFENIDMLDSIKLEMKEMISTNKKLLILK